MNVFLYLFLFSFSIFNSTNILLSSDETLNTFIKFDCSSINDNMIVHLSYLKDNNDAITNEYMLDSVKISKNIVLKSLQINGITQIRLFLNNRSEGFIYAFPNDTILITFEENHRNIFISSKNIETRNLIIISKMIENYMANDDYFLLKSYLNKDITKLTKLIDSLKEFYINSIEKSRLRKEVRELLLDDVIYWSGFEKINYIIANLSDKDKLKIFDEDLLENVILADININTPKSCYSSKYKYFTSKLHQLLVTCMFIKWGYNDTFQDEVIELLKNSSKNDNCNIFHNVFKYVVDYCIDKSTHLTHINFCQKIIEQYNVLIHHESILDNLKYKMKYKINEISGNRFIDFALPDSSKNDVYLSKFIGKVVYVVFWGTWCSPCLKEKVYLKKVIEEFNNDSNFIVISIALEDNNFENWVSYIRENDKGCINLYMEDKFKNEIAKKYLVESLPRFVLINRRGVIASFEAVSPSQSEILIDMINVLLNEE